MRKTDTLIQLRGIQSLREVQRLVAEKDAIEAAQSLGEAQRLLNEQQTLCDEQFSRWREAAATANPCDPAFRLRGALLVQQEQQAKQAAAQHRAAADSHETAMASWGETLAHVRLAAEQCRSARRSYHRRMDDRALEAATDLFVSRRAVR